MNKLIPIIVVLLTSCFSCVKKDDNPGCNVKGTWMGRWSAETQGGTWVCNVINDETNLNGYVSILFDLPSLENHGVSFDGILRDKQIGSKIYLSGVTITVKGGVETDSSAVGNFSTTIGLSGIWKGVLLPTINLSVVDSFSLDIQFPSNLNIACDANRKHLFIGNGNVLSEYSYSGGFIKTISTNYSGSFCFDGNHFWYSDSGKGKIVEVDTLGNTVSEFINPVNYIDAIIYDEGNLGLLSGYSRKIYTVTNGGASIRESDFQYILISGFCRYNDGYLAITNSIAGTIFDINSSGDPLKAFKFSKGYCYGIARDGDYLWCAIVRYISTSSNPPSPPITDVKLFKLKFNS